MTFLSGLGLSRWQLRDSGEGLITQNFERQSSRAGSTPLTNGVVYFGAIGLLAGDLITNVVVHISTAGVAMTLSKVGLYDRLGNRLGLSLDQGAAWATIGTYVIPLTTPYFNPSAGVYYGALIVTATTPPAALTGTAATALSGVGANPPPAAQMAAQVDLPAVAVFNVAGAAGSMPWFGVS